MNLVDSSGWLCYFAGEANSSHFLPALRDTESLLVPVVVLYEVFKVMLRGRGERDAFQAVMAMQKGRVVDLTPQLALTASRLSLKHNLPMADSMILATAQVDDSIIWTQDAHFKAFPKVKYFAKK